MIAIHVKMVASASPMPISSLSPVSVPSNVQEIAVKTVIVSDFYAEHCLYLTLFKLALCSG